jgi:DNA-binding transcriptional LysR family regulator
MPIDKNRTFSESVTPAFNLELRHVRAFVALVEHGSVTGAAHAMSLAQSTVSETIAALERELGTALITHQRGTRSVTLTPAGQVLLPHARNVLAAVGQTYVAIANAAVSARGFVNIIANESVSTYLLSRVLTATRRRWRNTRFTVSVAACPEVREGVKNGGFDLGLFLTAVNRKSPASANSIEGERVVAPLVPLVVFVTPNHPLAKPASRGPVRRCSLDSFPVFVSDAAGEYRGLLERFFREDDLPGPRLESTGSIEGVKAAVFSDPQAAGILPSYAVAKEVQARQVVALNLQPALPAVRLVALVGSRSLHPSMPELLIEIGRICAPASTKTASPRNLVLGTRSID